MHVFFKASTLTLHTRPLVHFAYFAAVVSEVRENSISMSQVHRMASESEFLNAKVSRLRPKHLQLLKLPNYLKISETHS